MGFTVLFPAVALKRMHGFDSQPVSWGCHLLVTLNGHANPMRIYLMRFHAPEAVTT